MRRYVIILLSVILLNSCSENQGIGRGAKQNQVLILPQVLLFPQVILSAFFCAKDLLKVAKCHIMEILRAKRLAQDDVEAQPLGLAPPAAIKIPLQENTRNPFKPKGLQSKKGKNSLNEFDLSALKFVGWIEQESKIWALIEQPNSLIIRVREGETMGKNKAQVKDIQAHALILEEKVKGIKKQRITLYLKNNL